MKRKHRIGCLLFLVYCITCSCFVGIKNCGFFELISDIGTLGGAQRSARDHQIGRTLDIVTAPIQVAIGIPLAAVNYINNHTGENGRRLAKAKQQEADYIKYSALLNEDFSQVYSNTDIWNPTNKVAMKALNNWIWSHGRQFTEDDVRKFAGHLFDHLETMIEVSYFWRLGNIPADVQNQALDVCVHIAIELNRNDVEPLLWSILSNGDGDGNWLISDDMLAKLVECQNEIVSRCASEEQEHRTSYRNYLERRRSANSGQQ